MALRTRYSFCSLFLILCVFLGVAVGSTSCVSPKTIVYFQGDTSRNFSTPIVQNYIPTIQKNDLLSIVVGSLNVEANEIFNNINKYTSTTTSYGRSVGGGTQAFGYLVDPNGEVELPLIGKAKLDGLPTQVAADTIRKRLLLYLKEPSVTIRNINFKVSVLGEVVSPAVYVIPDEKISLPEVLSLAGDLTILGRRDNIMIIRENGNKREYARIDLTSREVFDSPYYYLRKNDVIYVEPMKARMNSTDRTVQLVPLFVSVVTAISLVFIRFR